MIKSDKYWRELAQRIEDPVQTKNKRPDTSDLEIQFLREHLTENEFGHVYAIESKDEKHSDHGIKCGHKYHRTCISSWAKVHMNCPLCKSTIVKLHLAKE